MTVRPLLKTVVRRAGLAALGVTERLPDARDVLLTFDDGPEPGVTEPILERLAHYNASAAFFTVGYQVARSGDLIAKVHRAGHRIGNHSYGHPVDIPATTSEVMDDLQRCQSEIASKIGVSPTLYRPPLGQLRWSNLRAARRIGLRTVLWTIDPRDWQLTSRAEAVERGRELAASIRGGEIVLLHESNKHVLDVLDWLLPALRDSGLQLGQGASRL